MTRRRAVAGAVLVTAALALAGALAARRVPLDPVVLNLLPPGSTVPVLVGLDGELTPAPGWRVQGDAVVFRRGSREAARPLASLARESDGAPRVRSVFFPLGTDRLGRDVAARLARGALVSLGIALAGVVGAGALALAVAGLSVFGGRLTDAALSAAGDALLAVPRVLLVMVLAALVRPSPAGVALLLALTGWPGIARLLRAEARVLRGSDVLLAARGAGASGARIVALHLLPLLAGTLAVALALRFGSFLLLEASLSFLGFGVPPPLPSWGGMLADGREVLFEAWWVAALPGAALAAAILAANAAVDRLSHRRTA